MYSHWLHVSKNGTVCKYRKKTPNSLLSLDVFYKFFKFLSYSVLKYLKEGKTIIHHFVIKIYDPSKVGSYLGAEMGVYGLIWALLGLP